MVTATLLKADQTIRRLITFNENVLQVNRSIAPLSNPITVQFSKYFESCPENPTPISYFEVMLKQVGNKKQ